MTEFGYALMGAGYVCFVLFFGWVTTRGKRRRGALSLVLSTILLAAGGYVLRAQIEYVMLTGAIALILPTIAWISTEERRTTGVLSMLTAFGLLIGAVVMLQRHDEKNAFQVETQTADSQTVTVTGTFSYPPGYWAAHRARKELRERLEREGTPVSRWRTKSTYDGQKATFTFRRR